MKKQELENLTVGTNLISKKDGCVYEITNIGEKVELDGADEYSMSTVKRWYDIYLEAFTPEVKILTTADLEPVSERKPEVAPQVEYFISIVNSLGENLDSQTTTNPDIEQFLADSGYDIIDVKNGEALNSYVATLKTDVDEKIEAIKETVTKSYAHIDGGSELNIAAIIQVVHEIEGLTIKQNSDHYSIKCGKKGILEVMPSKRGIRVGAKQSYFTESELEYLVNERKGKLLDYYTMNIRFGVSSLEEIKDVILRGMKSIAVGIVVK